MYDDTIAAVATPPGEAALAIIRLSGPDALAIGRTIFSGRLHPRTVSLGWACDPGSGTRIDQCMAVYLPPPATYTREPMVELTCHGGTVVVQQVLAALLHAGARLARPGEFTLRAFLNGRIDLAQAEAVLDVIQARTRAGLQVALLGMQGGLSDRVRALRSALLQPLAYLTALVDFPEDEVGHQDVEGPLLAALAEVEALAAHGEQGQLYREGVRTAIVGRPNAGKSSLLNRLLGHDRAIVTDVPGTTRDTLEETTAIAGIPFVFVDTAGIHSTEDPVETLGIERSRRALEAADLVLLVLDASRPLSDEDRAIAAELPERPLLAIANKSDLPGAASSRWLRQAAMLPAVHGDGSRLLPLSALTGDGVDRLRQQMTALVLHGEVAPAEEILVSNPRHQAALRRAMAALTSALMAHRRRLTPDLVAIDVTAAVNALGEITGETAGEDLLQTIFSRFCIGK